MPDEVVHVIEDEFHRVQHPQPDNPASDQDLGNAAQVAVWNCEPGLRGRIQASASNGHLVLTGTVETEQQRQAVEAAVLALKADIKDLTNEIEIVGAAKPDDRKSTLPLARHEVAGEPMLYLSRFCGVEPYSLTAALHEALDALDLRFAALGLAVPEDIVVIYRNRLPESVMLDVGYAVPGSVRVEGGDELKLGRTPEGIMLAAPAEYGSRRLFEVHDQLIRQAHLAALSPSNFTWQRFPLEIARLRAHHPAAPLYLPVS